MKTLLENMNQIIEGSWEDDEAADKAAFDMQPKTNICPDCEGGRYDPEGECETCGGAGEIFEDGIEEGRDVREMTNKIWEAMDDEMLDPRTVAEAAMSYMSESQVADMAQINGWFEYEDEDMEEGNEFSGALAAAKATGDDKFKVGSKEYDVTEDELGEDPWGLGQ